MGEVAGVEGTLFETSGLDTHFMFQEVMQIKSNMAFSIFCSFLEHKMLQIKCNGYKCPSPGLMSGHSLLSTKYAYH